MSPSIPASEGNNSLRSGLCIDIPTQASANLEGSEPLWVSRAQSSDTYGMRSGTRPVVIQTESKSDSNPSNMRPQLISGSHLLRSSTGMRGLLLAETGGGLVELDLLGSRSGFKQGTAVVPGLVTPGGTSGAVDPPLACPVAGSNRRSKSGGIQGLIRHGTLLNQNVTPARNAAELKSLLGNSRSKIKSGAKLLPPPNLSHLSSSTALGSATVTLEQGRSRARVEVDILLDSELCVEGGYLSGRLHVKIRKVREKTMVLMAGGKMRVVGFEGIPGNNDRHIFYQHAAPLSAISASSHILYSSGPDEEGFSQAHGGQHIVPFAMKLPISCDIHVGAKGPFDSRSGVLVKYIAIASFTLKDSDTSKHSIAHFYRSCEVYPYFNSSLILAPAIHPLVSASARSIFLGGPGKLKLTANLHRNVWVAGQRCCVGIIVDNESTKAVKGLTLSLIRTTTIFRSRPHLDVASCSFTDADACETTTTRKLVAETVLEAGQRGLRGHVTEKGWWVGVDPGVRSTSTHFILLPHDTLSIVRSRLVEVTYAIRVSLIAGSLSSDVSVMLSLHIINSLSIDPPPSYPSPFNHPGVHAPVPPIPVPAVGSETASSNLTRDVNTLGDKKEVMLGLDGQATFDEVIVRGGALASGAASANALHECGMPCQKSHIMPRLEEGLDIEDTGHYSSIVASRPRSDASEDSRFCKSQDGSVDKEFSDDGETDDAMNEETIDNFTIGVLRNLSSDEEAVSFAGTAGPDDHDIHKKSAEEQHQIEGYHNERRTTGSAKKSSKMSERHTDPERASSRLPRKLAPRESATAITDSRSILRPKAPVYRAKPGHGSLEDRTSRSYNDVALTSSGMTKTPFSQRVEKLIAAHRGATNLAQLETNPATTTEAERSSPVNNTTYNKHVLPSNQCSNISEPQLYLLPSSVPSINRCPPTLLTSSIAKRVMSDNITITTAAPSASFSGTVRSRIAELEGRTSVISGGRPDCGRFAG